MKTPARQNIEEITITAENLQALSQTLFEVYEKLDDFQLKNLLGLVYDLSSKINSWVDAEEKIVFEIEEQQRNGKRN